jgi:phosphoribosylformylglycinamidine synthase
VPDIGDTEELSQVGKFLLAHPNIASKKWVYEQYDSMVGVANRTTNRPPTRPSCASGARSNPS